MTTPAQLPHTEDMHATRLLRASVQVGTVLILAMLAGCGLADPPTSDDASDVDAAHACASARDCPTGQVCHANACGAPTACVSSRTCPAQVCDTTRGYCADCVTDVDCTDGMLCRSTSCVPPPMACDSDRDCSGMGLVCNTTTQLCVECVRTTDCPSDQRCSTASTCIPRLCATGETRCANGLTIRTCLPDGSDYGQPVPCGSGMGCVADTCMPVDAGPDAGADAGPDAGRDVGLDIDAGPPLYRGMCPVVGCDTSHYDSTAPTALGGVYPYLAGDSGLCRGWKLAATVCTTPPTMVAHDWSCPASGGFTDPRFGTFCMSTASPQWICNDDTGACNVSSFGQMFTMRDCMGNEVAQR